MNHIRPSRPQSEQDLRDALRERIMGFRVTQMICIAAKLGLADRLASGPRMVDDLAAAIGAEPQALYRLMRGLASLGIFAEDAPRRFALTAQAELLRSDVQGSLRDTALLYAEDWMWQAYGNMMHSVRTGATAFTKTHGQPFYGYLHEHPRAALRFHAAMAGFSSQEAAEILEAHDFARAGSVVDIGGGHGVLLAALLRAHPHLTGILFDLPSVLTGAAGILGEMDIASRARCVAGDFFDDAPADADLYLMKGVLHNWEDEDAARILSTCRAAMKKDARLLVIERMVPEGNAPAEAKLFDINMLVVTGGRERTESEYRRLFEHTGLMLERVVPTRTPFSIVVATVR